MFQFTLRIDSEEIAWHGQLLKELFQHLKFQRQYQSGFIQTSIGYLSLMGISILSYCESIAQKFPRLKISMSRTTAKLQRKTCIPHSHSEKTNSSDSADRFAKEPSNSPTRSTRMGCQIEGFQRPNNTPQDGLTSKMYL